MSVSVDITYRDDVATPGRSHLPLATEGVFITYWLPAAKKLGCVWMPLFESGAPVPLADLPDVLDELARLRDHFAAAAAKSPSPDLCHIRDRSAWLLGELKKIDPATIKEFWIG